MLLILLIWLNTDLKRHYIRLFIADFSHCDYDEQNPIPIDSSITPSSDYYPVHSYIRPHIYKLIMGQEG